uniref:Succinate:cytochrome c oxidoreductase subunit 3 n=1 Tax=Gelidiella fanii TaxID=485435 RepID=A0A7G9IWA1_9FLOR|nr:succinate:cytochrome c oxidoreductase subunit 3 [Gelidiella fanii]
MFRDFSLLNRPLSPHLTIYLPQYSSLFSIWHRFSGILLLILLAATLFLINIISFCGLLDFFYILNVFLSSKIKKLIFLFLSSISMYHSVNGIRHLTWNLGIWLHKDYLIHFMITLIFIFSLMLIII